MLVPTVAKLVSRLFFAAFLCSKGVRCVYVLEKYTDCKLLHYFPCYAVRIHRHIGGKLIDTLRTRGDDSKASDIAGDGLRDPADDAIVGEQPTGGQAHAGLTMADASATGTPVERLSQALIQCDACLVEVQDENQRLLAKNAHLEAQALANQKTAHAEIAPPVGHLAQELDSCGEYLMDAKHENQRLLACNNSLHILVSERDREIEKARHAANHDHLTGLCNRRSVPQHLRRLFSEAKQHQHCVAVVMIDLDGFKQINDRLGHAAGDQLLQELARRIALSVRDADLVCRYGGDEFLLILPVMDRSGARELVKTIAQQIAEPFALDGQAVSVTASAGIAMYPDDAKDAKHLLEAADAGMYRHKPKLARKPKIRLPSASSQGEQAFGA